MHIDDARELKAQLIRTAASVRELGSTEAPVVVGVRTFGAGRYGLAIRHDGPTGATIARRAAELAGADVDIRDIGAIRPLIADADRWSAAALQRRERPLRPGLSVAEQTVTAGTIGAFVRLAGDSRRYLLSNNHVLADSDRAAVGSPVLQPGPADGGTGTDRVGTLSHVVPLDPDRPNLVDAALMLLDDAIDIDPVYPCGPVTGTAPADDADDRVEKVGRTTGRTQGRITAFELDGVAVGYPVGTVVFDDQIEVTGLEGPFSAGGDSGSLVYLPASAAAVGLLFAGSERGGPDGTGLTFCNPIGAVLAKLDVTLTG